MTLPCLNSSILLFCVNGVSGGAKIYQSAARERHWLGGPKGDHPEVNRTEV